MAKKLNQAALGKFGNNVAVPQYDRKSLSAGIVHIGVGNFHRAHQAIYLDRLFNMGLDHDWALIGAGIMRHDAAVRKDLGEQDWLYTVVELDPSALNARVCGSMIDFCETDPARLVEVLSHPEIRIVSLTVTEGGYFIDAKTGGFDINNANIANDIANPGDPTTVFGIMIAALAKRRDAGIAPFTVMSCDNIPGNGHVAKTTVCGLAGGISSELRDWIESNVAFPNGMVDCITPATSEVEKRVVRENFGIDDARPVVCEPFRQWVLEDKFPSGRPALERVGVEFVGDVGPYELMKLRILNGGHAAIAYPAALLGFAYVHEAAASPLILAYLDKLIPGEIIPTLTKIPNVDFNTYYSKVKTRYANARIGDTIPRLCLDGSNRQPKFILPVIRDRLAAGKPFEGLALEVALWCRYCSGTGDDNTPLEVVDERAPYLKDHAMRAKSDPAAFLSMVDIFGDLGQHGEFVAAFAVALTALWSDGTAATLKRYVNGELFRDHLLR